MKPIEFLGDALAALRAFPEAARRSAGFQLDRVQHGLEPLNWKPMTSIGPGVLEIRVREEGDAYRVLYVARFPEAIYVIHCFPKKSRRTPQHEMHVARRRLAGLMRFRR